MKRTLIALALMAAPSLAFAQGASIDAAQFRAHRIQAVMTMDADHDGRLSPAEFSAMAAKRAAAGHAGKGGGEKLFAKLDANGDGYLSGDEVGALAERRFAKLDTNHDGKLDAAERQAAHHGRGGDQPTGF